MFAFDRRNMMHVAVGGPDSLSFACKEENLFWCIRRWDGFVRKMEGATRGRKRRTN